MALLCVVFNLNDTEMYNNSSLSAVRGYSKQAAEAARVAPSVAVNPEVASVVAGVTNTGVTPVSLGAEFPLVIAHTAGTDGADVIAIGDPDGVVAAIFNLSPEASYTTCTWNKAQLASFFRKGAIIKEVNVEVSTASQFTQSFTYRSASFDGSSGSKPLQGALVASKRATDQNTTIRTLDLRRVGGQLLLDHNNALFMTIAAGNTVTISLTLSAIQQ